MKPQKHETLVKKALSVKRRIDELGKLIINAPTRPLPKKIFKGHWRFFKVREDVLRSSLGAQVKKVVDATNTWVLGHKKTPESYDRYCSYEVYYPYSKTPFYAGGQGLRKIVGENAFEKLNFPDFFERKWFSVYESVRSFGTKNIVTKVFFPNVPGHMIEFAYKRAYIIEEKIVVGDYESELHNCYEWMYHNNGWEIISGRRHWDEWDANLTKKRAVKKLLDKEIQDTGYEE